MPRIVLELPPGLNSDDTTYSAAGRWADGSNVRFWRGKAEAVGGWEAIINTPLTGVCRKVFGWTDNANNLNIAAGTHSALQVYQGGALFDITPFGPPTLLGNNPLAVTSASPVVTVTHVAHGLTTGDSVNISGATTLATITPNGTFPITVLTADTYTYTFTSNANNNTSGGGGRVIITPQKPLPAGNIDGTGGAGYGTGTYSTGTWSSPSTADYFPRTWSLSAWGENLIANPRNGGIFTWTNNTANRATAIVTAPTQVTYALVAPTRQVFALGCNAEAFPHAFDPLIIRHSSIGDNTDWTTSAASTAREYRLPGGGRIVCGAVMGENLLIWTSSALYLGTFVGSLAQPWRFDKVGDQCGCIGPNAFAVVGQQAMWVGPNLQFYVYTLGSQPALMPCPIQDDFADFMAPAQTDKITMSSVAPFDEVRIDYPDSRDGVECSRYLAAHIPTLMGSPENAWYRGVMARTAFVDTPPSPNSYPIGVDTSGNMFWHEKGQSANGGPLSWFIETADNYLDPNSVMQMRALWPDFNDQIGPVSVQVISRFNPQATDYPVSGQIMGAGQVKSDLRATGRLAKIRYSASASPSFARFGNITIDVTPTGRR
ncbi:hypothetical protein [Phenylobacterium sp.]|uniref:hypothetical protein n=1 Tax=Phenylobacterium sp. TaxID=1871053 RepID=UPI0025DA7947|nr:hypothetical protein [Phenylobacterium sp.]MCA6262712.1 hypothetical protein [Phenylobacterium sp.]